MKIIKNLIVMMVLAFIVIAFISFSTVTQSDAAESFKVSIGSSRWLVKEAYAHNVTSQLLKKGHTSFVVSTSAKDSYQISLSDKQIEDILAGSTVIVTTKNGTKKVKIGPIKKKAAKSGW